MKNRYNVLLLICYFNMLNFAINKNIFLNVLSLVSNYCLECLTKKKIKFNQCVNPLSMGEKSFNAIKTNYKLILFLKYY